jgi:hypothetical protein
MGRVKPQSIGHDITRGKSKETVERLHYDKMTPNYLLAEIVSLILIPRRDQLIRKGLVVEQSTTPMNRGIEGLTEGIRNCQPKVPQGCRISYRPRPIRVSF